MFLTRISKSSTFKLWLFLLRVTTLHTKYIDTKNKSEYTKICKINNVNDKYEISQDKNDNTTDETKNSIDYNIRITNSENADSLTSIIM
ncbi:MAG: hypothetical protein ABJB76_05515 [Candidatus Nitrosocosmicus sp.]